jgi:primosomal protein N'
MYFYNVLINKKIPSISLTYKSDILIEKGALVVILLRKNEVYGIIVSIIPVENIADVSKISEIKSVLPYIFNNQQLRLQNIISYNTFNSPNVVLDAFLNPLLSLTQKDFKTLQSNFLLETIALPSLKVENKKTEYYLDTEVVLRIIYIIRISILAYIKSFLEIVGTNTSNQINILVLFPEKKYLERVYKDLVESAFESEFVSDNVFINLTIFTGDKTKSNRQSIYHILDIYTGDKTALNINIILSTRSGLFLPFDTLHDLLVIDESNSMYIQEQNSLYFDARELAFILSEVFNSNLHFISRVPSIRLHSFYPETILDSYLINNKENNQKPLKIKITGQNRKIDQFKLISNSVLKLVRKDDTSEGLASEIIDVNFENWEE